jgi:hypothetical protein
MDGVWPEVAKTCNADKVYNHQFEIACVAAAEDEFVQDFAAASVLKETDYELRISKVCTGYNRMEYKSVVGEDPALAANNIFRDLPDQDDAVYKGVLVEEPGIKYELTKVVRFSKVEHLLSADAQLYATQAGFALYSQPMCFSIVAYEWVAVCLPSVCFGGV